MTVLRWTALLVGCSVSFPLPSAGASPEQTEPRIDLALRNLPLPPSVDGLYGLPDGRNRGRQLYLEQLTREAQAQGLPPALADAVASVESGYDSNARGMAGEIGLMQILPSTAAMLGHTGRNNRVAEARDQHPLRRPLPRSASRLANGDLCRSLMKYRAGHGEERMSPLSLQYCARARARLAPAWARPSPTHPFRRRSRTCRRPHGYRSREANHPARVHPDRRCRRCRPGSATAAPRTADGSGQPRGPHPDDFSQARIAVAKNCSELRWRYRSRSRNRPAPVASGRTGAFSLPALSPFRRPLPPSATAFARGLETRGSVPTPSAIRASALSRATASGAAGSSVSHLPRLMTSLTRP